MFQTFACLFAVAAIAPAQTFTFSGELNAGDRFEHSLGRGLIFLLVPINDGWTAEIQLRGANGDNLASCVCYPLHGPRVFEIQSSDYFNENHYHPVKNDMRSINFSLTGRDYAKACHELGVIDGDVRRGSTTIGTPGFWFPPTGRCTLHVNIRGKTSIEHLSFSANVRMPN